jgi:hypothetical protein
MPLLNGRSPYLYCGDELRKVARDACVSWQASRYSVPWQYVGKQVWGREQGVDVEVRYIAVPIKRACGEARFSISSGGSEGGSVLILF